MSRPVSALPRRRVVVMQGVPGSGKSYRARQYLDYDCLGEGVIVSADDHFMVPDMTDPLSHRSTYVFNPEKLGEAHASCFRRFVDALRSGARLVIVDNTNTSPVEIAPYVLAADAYGVEAFIVRVECPVDVAAARNTHGVPARAVEAMAGRIARSEMPPWWTVVPLHLGERIHDVLPSREPTR